MKNTFDINRFGKVLVNDLNKACQNYGYSMLILMLIPAIYCFFYIAFPFVLGDEVNFAGPVGRFTMLSIALITLMVSFPSKVYGNLTDKRYGSDFLLLPASTFEKFLSMVIVTAVIAPVVFAAGFFAVDSLLEAFGLFKGGNLVAMVNRSAVMDNGYIEINLWILFFLSMALNMLIFLLGAVYFKKAKPALTILCLFAVSVVFSLLFGSIISKIIENGSFMSFTEDDVVRWIENHVEHAGLYLNMLILGIQVFWYAVVGGLLYLRVKTLKH